MNEPVAENAVTVKLFSRFSDSLRRRAIGAVFCGLLSLFLTAIFALARIGFPNPARPLIVVLALSWTITVLPFALHALFARSTRTGAWYRAEGFITLGVLLTLAVAGWLTSKTSFPFLPFLAGAGIIAAMWVVGGVVMDASRKKLMLFVSAALAYALWLAGVEWANGYLSPLFVENLVLHGGERHFDTLFHASMANMLSAYGVVSTGWDGVSFTPYHFGSAWLFAQLANLSGMGALDFYQLGVPVILIPLFIRGLFILAAEVGETFEYPPEMGTALTLVAAFLLLACATIGFLPPSALHSAGFWEVGPFLSESHVLALAFALMVLSVAFVFHRQSLHVAADPRSHISVSGILFLCVFVPLAVGVAGIIKVSQMALLVGVAFFLFVRLGFYRRPVYIVGLVLTCAVAFATYKLVVWPGSNEGVDPLNFLRSHIPFTWWPAFPLLHLVWTWIYVYLRVKKENARNLGDVRTLIVDRRIVDVEMIVFLAVIGLAPGAVFNLAGASHYFSDVQRWFALALVLANLPFAIQLLSNHDLVPFQRFRPIRNVRVEKFVVTILFGCIVATMAFTGLMWAGKFVRSNMDTRRELQEVLGIRPAASLLGSIKRFAFHPGNAEVRTQLNSQFDLLGDGPTFQRALQSSPRYQIVRALLTVGRLPVGERSQTLLHIDPSLKLFWGFIPYPRTCQFSVMLGPALSGTALLDGVPAGCTLNGYYGTEAYPEKKITQTVLLSSPATLCARAKNKGFNHVVALVAGQNDQVSLNRLKCEKMLRP